MSNMHILQSPFMMIEWPFLEMLEMNDDTSTEIGLKPQHLAFCQMNMWHFRLYRINN